MAVVTRCVALMTALLLVLGSAACSTRGESVDDKAAAHAALLKRPTLEAETARITAVRDAVRDALSTRLRLDAWSDLGSADEAGCADFTDIKARTRFLSSLLLKGGVPDATWPAAVKVVAEVAGPAGFGAPEAVVDRPGQHDVVLRGERGSRLTFGTMANATLALEVGCHLPKSVHDAG